MEVDYIFQFRERKTKCLSFLCQKYWEENMKANCQEKFFDREFSMKEKVVDSLHSV